MTIDFLGNRDVEAERLFILRHQGPGIERVAHGVVTQDQRLFPRGRYVLHQVFKLERAQVGLLDVIDHTRGDQFPTDDGAVPLSVKQAVRVVVERRVKQFLPSPVRSQVDPPHFTARYGNFRYPAVALMEINQLLGQPVDTLERSDIENAVRISFIGNTNDHEVVKGVLFLDLVVKHPDILIFSQHVFGVVVELDLRKLPGKEQGR